MISVELFSPLDGTAVDLDNVPDPVFSERMMGKGIAIIPNNGVAVAPINGSLVSIFKTLHAYTMSSNGVEILVHLGIDTVNLNGEGFARIAQEGTQVNASDLIVKMDVNKLQKLGYNVISPIVITNTDSLGNITSLVKEGDILKAGKTPILRIVL